MKDLQTILDSLDKDPKSGKWLPTAQLVEDFRSSCPLTAEELHVLAGCLDACSEQMYEYYRVMIDIFRQEIRHIQPNEELILAGIKLGILDDEEWEG